jgi:hypothetical protein
MGFFKDRIKKFAAQRPTNRGSLQHRKISFQFAQVSFEQTLKNKNTASAEHFPDVQAVSVMARRHCRLMQNSNQL